MFANGLNLSDDDDAYGETVSNKKTLSVPLSTWSITSTAYPILQQIYSAAQFITDSHNSIVKAPVPQSGSGNHFLAISKTNPDQPHSVRLFGKDSSITCDSNCVRFKSFKVCSHTIATAGRVGCLPEFIKWFAQRKQSPI